MAPVVVPRAQDARVVSVEYSRRTRRTPPARATDAAIADVCRAIARASSRGLSSTVADVPTFLFGSPFFKVDDVTAAVKETLESLGYSVLTHAGSPTIAVDWSRSDPDDDDVLSAKDEFDVGL